MAGDKPKCPRALLSPLEGLPPSPRLWNGGFGAGVPFSCLQSHPERVPSPSAAEISASPAAEVLEYTATTLSCDVPGREGHPEELIYVWYKNSAWLKEGPAHTLLFPAVTAADAGYYSCQVTNSQGSDTAQAIRLSVTCECHLGLWKPHKIPPKINVKASS